jgi:hypothetical protein
MQESGAKKVHTTEITIIQYSITPLPPFCPGQVNKFLALATTFSTVKP